MQPLVFGLTSPSASEALEEARAEIVGLGLPFRAFTRWKAPSWPEGIAWLADCVYSLALRQVVVDEPREVLLSWNAWLQPHADRTAPYDCLNAVVMLRRGASGGRLTIDGFQPLECADGDLVIFDGQIEHEVSPIVALADGGYRASLCYYLPLPA